MKHLILAFLLLLPLTAPAPYALSWQPVNLPGIEIVSYRIYWSTNSYEDVLRGNHINWILSGSSTTTNYTLDVASPPIMIGGITSLTTNGESAKCVVVFIPPPTNALVKYFP